MIFLILYVIYTPHSGCSEMTARNCASNHPVGYWPLPLDAHALKNNAYNALVYEFDDCFAAFTADAFGLNGEGDTLSEALTSLGHMIELRVRDGDGGVFPDTSPFDYQHELNKRLESGWRDDGVQVKSKTEHVITVFST